MCSESLNFTQRSQPLSSSSYTLQCHCYPSSSPIPSSLSLSLFPGRCPKHSNSQLRLACISGTAKIPRDNIRSLCTYMHAHRRGGIECNGRSRRFPRGASSRPGDRLYIPIGTRPSALARLLARRYCKRARESEDADAG